MQNQTISVYFFQLQASCVCCYCAFLADLLQTGNYCCFEAGDLGQILSPHLLVGHNSMYQICCGVILMSIIELQNPSVIAYGVLVTLCTLANQTCIGQGLNVVAVECYICSEAGSQADRLWPTTAGCMPDSMRISLPR